MKTFDTNYLGGMPLVLDDFRFMESIHKDAFEAIMKPYALNHDIVILSGCEITTGGGVSFISEGWILFEGEICRVPSHFFLAVPSSQWSFVKTQIELTAVDSFKVFPSNPDTSPKATYKENIVKIQPNYTGSDPNHEYSLKVSFVDVLESFLKPSFIGSYFEAIVSTYTDVGEFGSTTYEVKEFMWSIKKNGNIVYKPKSIVGECFFEDIPDGDSHLFDLSASTYVPDTLIICPIANSSTLVVIKIDANKVYLHKYIGTEPYSGVIVFNYSVPVSSILDI